MPDTLSTIFQALADPTRRAIVSRLKEGPSSVGDLAAPFTMSKPAISQHLKVLESAGLIERHTRAQWRTCSLRTEPLDDAAEWVNHHRDLWNEQFDLLDQRVQQLNNEKQKSHRDPAPPTGKAEQ